MVLAASQLVCPYGDTQDRVCGKWCGCGAAGERLEASTHICDRYSGVSRCFWPVRRCRRWWSCGYRGRRSLGDDGATVHVRSFPPIGDVDVKSWGLISVFGRAGFEIRPPAGDHREGRRDTNSGNFRAKRPLGATPRCLAVVHGALDGLVPGCSTKDPSELMAWCALVDVVRARVFRLTAASWKKAVGDEHAWLMIWRYGEKEATEHEGFAAHALFGVDRPEFFAALELVEIYGAKKGPQQAARREMGLVFADSASDSTSSCGANQEKGKIAWARLSHHTPSWTPTQAWKGEGDSVAAGLRLTTLGAEARKQAERQSRILARAPDSTVTAAPAAPQTFPPRVVPTVLPMTMAPTPHPAPPQALVPPLPQPPPRPTLAARATLRQIPHGACDNARDLRWAPRDQNFPPRCATSKDGGRCNTRARAFGTPLSWRHG